MADTDDRILFVPLRSNAHQLLAGAPVAALRRKLKYASLTYDRIYLEAGSLTIQASAGGSIVGPNNHVQFQTPAGRSALQGAQFQLSVGIESTPGVQAEVMRPLLSWDQSTIAWQPTLTPFVTELPATCDWIVAVRPAEDPEIKKLAGNWSHSDGNNDALLAAVPQHFVRKLIIDNANQDLATAALGRAAIMQDPKHLEVITSRLDSTTSWKPIGFSVPVLAPNVANLSWDEIVEVRNLPAITTYRSLLRDLEAEALQESIADPDVERVLKVLMERRLARLAEPPSGPVRKLFTGAATSFFIGTGIGALTTSWTGPAGLVGGAAIGAVIDVVRSSVHDVRARRARGWVSVHQRLL